MTHKDKIKSLKNLLKSKQIDYFILPNSDEFFSEYLPDNEKRIEYLTGFSGSNALIIFSQNKSYFFTDGRYVLQARNEIDLSEFEIINIAEKSVISWIEDNLGNEDNLALDPKLNSLNFVKNCQDSDANLILLESDLIAEIWKNNEFQNSSKIFLIPENISGFSSINKRKNITQNCDWDFLVITDPQSLCWLLNIRASDVKYTPLLLAYAILFKNGEVDLFIDEKRIGKDLNLEKVKIIPATNFGSRIADLRKSQQKVQIDPVSTNYWIYQLLLENKFAVNLVKCPCLLPKACKNLVEISGAVKSHEVDGLAVTKFLFWLQSHNNIAEIDELKAEEKLLEFRRQDPSFIYPSFRSISSFASNGAIIHYHSEFGTNKKFAQDSLYLIDSGGQYLGDDFAGTTDITRVVAIGAPNKEMVRNYTLVLKGHIALASAKFSKGTTGANLDILARDPLEKEGKNYDHGTGHGVGSFLSVHEGPCGISKRSNQEFLEGMILSNEPGFYKEDEYGIRIENLMVVEKSEKEGFLQFNTLTLAPLEYRLIDFDLLDSLEKKWLRDYHERVFKTLENGLNEDEKKCFLGLLSKFR